MNTRIILSILAVTALITMSCGITVNLPVDRIVTGETQTETIAIPTPDSEDIELELDFGAGELDLTGGAEGALVSGTATYNVADFKPRVETRGDRIILSSGELQINGIPNVDDNIENHWDLQLGDTPMALKIAAGAFQGDFDLGGVPLLALEVSDGASEVRMDFSEPNPLEMGTFRYSTGASTVRLTGLANANFEEMTFRSGLGSYTLDFSGELKRDANVSIESGVSETTVIVPEGTRARVIVTGALSNVDASGGWDRSGSEYVLGSGSGPEITIRVEMGAGNLRLQTN